MMADDINREDRVIAFLEHLTRHEREREHLEHALLEKVVETANREGYEFSAEDFKRAVKVQISYGIFEIKWPPGRR